MPTVYSSETRGGSMICPGPSNICFAGVMLHVSAAACMRGPTCTAEDLMKRAEHCAKDSTSAVEPHIAR
jgi:hypothetical protein